MKFPFKYIGLIQCITSDALNPLFFHQQKKNYIILHLILFICFRKRWFSWLWHNQTLGRCCSPRWCSCQIQCRCSGSDLLWYKKNSYSGPCRCAQTLSRIPRKICWGSLSWSHLQSSRCKFHFWYFVSKIVLTYCEKIVFY